MRKKKLAIGLLAVLMMIPAVNVGAATTIQQQVQVSGTGLQITQTPIRFSDIQLDVKRTQSSVATTEMYALDGRGTDAGYGATVSATDFTMVKDIGGVNETFVISASAVKITAQYVDAIAGVPVNFAGGEGVLASSQVMSNTDTRIFGVVPGVGAGGHKYSVKYDLSLPRSMKTSSGKDVGVMQGTYKSTFTYTITAGI